MSEQLKPCPFCGDDGDKGRQHVTQMVEGRPTFDRITCRACGAMCPEPNWNRRADPLAASHQRLKEALADAQNVLAMLTDPERIQQSRVQIAWAQAVAAEAKAREALRSAP